MKEKINPLFFLFARIRSSFNENGIRVLDEENTVRSEVGGTLHFEGANKLMGSVSNDGDLNFLISKEGAFGIAMIYAWAKRRSASGNLEADLGFLSSYNDLSIKVIQND